MTNPPCDDTLIQLQIHERGRSSISIVPAISVGDSPGFQHSRGLEWPAELAERSVYENIALEDNISLSSDLNHETQVSAVDSISPDIPIGRDQSSQSLTDSVADTPRFHFRSASDSHAPRRISFMSSARGSVSRMHEDFISHVLSLTRGELNGSFLTVLNPFVPPDLVLSRCPVRRIWSANEALSLGVCPICLEPYRQRMMVRTLPSCRHVVHKPCIDKWIRKSHKYRCPLDNLNIVPDQTDPCFISIEFPQRYGESSDTIVHYSDHSTTIISDVPSSTDGRVPGESSLSEEPLSGA
jgi:hypothetical protein